MCYTKMKAFGKKFRIDDAASAELLTYDIAFVFEVPTANATKVSVNYVGILKDIEVGLWAITYTNDYPTM
jgi:hypothetical protein